MESSGMIEPKFIRFLTTAEIDSDELKIPKDIVRKYRDLLKSSFLLKFRNGYEIPVQLNEEKGSIVGISDLYDDFNLEAGQMLVFDFNGSTDFNVYVIGSDMTEIHYPNLVHSSQKKRHRVVSVRNGGLKFVTFVKEDNPVSDDLEAPGSFKSSFPLVPGYQTFVFSNGKKIVGGYNRDSGKFYGLRKFCQILGIEDFSGFNLILSSYDEIGMTTISVFDDHFVEILFPRTPLSPGCNSHNPSVHSRIEINVQPCHMYKYSYGVDISTQYERITFGWKRRDYINVYAGDRAWRLHVKSRRNQLERCGILDGWIKFREDLGLAVGDVVVLQCTIDSFHHFSVTVIKNGAA